MKNLTKVVFLLLVVAMVVTSCSKPETPTIPEVPTVVPTVVQEVEPTVVPTEVPAVIPIEEAKEEPIEEQEDLYSCERDPYYYFILDLGEFGSYEAECGDGNTFFYFASYYQVRKRTAFSRQPSKKGDTLSFTTPDVATKILLMHVNDKLIYDEKVIKFLVDGEEWNAVLGDGYISYATNPRTLSPKDESTSIPPNSKIEIQALEDLTVPLLKVIASIEMEGAKIEDLLPIEIAEEKKIALEAKKREEYYRYEEEYYKYAIEIPVSITTGNPLVSPTCVPELEYLERTWFSIGVDGKYGTFKWYCEQGIFPKLSLNVQVVSTKNLSYYWAKPDLGPSEWVYNFNQPNIVKPWTTPLYSIFFEEDQDAMYSINLGKTDRNAFILSQNTDNYYFKDHYYDWGDQLEIIEKDQEMIMIIDGEKHLYLGPGFSYGPWIYEDETLYIAGGIFPVVQYGSNFTSPDQGEVWVTIDTEKLRYSLDVDLEKAELQVNSEWTTPRWTVSLDDFQLPGNHWEGKPARISYNDTLEVRFHASSSIGRGGMNGWIERNGEKFRLTTEFTLKPGESLSDFTIFLFNTYDQP